MKTVTESDKEFICDIHSPCFQNLTQREIEFIQASKTQVYFRKGDTLTKQGNFSSSILFIIKGIAKQFIEGSDAKNFNFRLFVPGDFVGISSVFTNNIYLYSTQAITDCQAYVIEKNALGELMKQNGEFGYSIISKYCQQEVKLYTSLQHVLFKQMNGKLAETLIYIDSFKLDFPNIYDNLSRKDIAEFCGITPESTIKLLKNFEKDDIIGLNDKDIVIKNLSKLKEIRERG